MKRKTQPHGITFIEVLVSISLLTLTLVELSHWIWHALATEQQAYQQIIAMEQLKGLATLQQTFPHQRTEWVADWESRTKKLLPGYSIQSLPHGKVTFTEMKWRTPTGSIWNCLSQHEADYSCVSIVELS